MYDLDFLNNYEGRIWFLNTQDTSIFDEAQKKYNIDIVEKKEFSVEYREYQYSLILSQKKGK